MHHRVEAPLAAQVDDPLAVGEVPADELRARIDRVAVPREQRVEDGDPIPPIQQILHTGAADVASAPRDQHMFHDNSPEPQKMHRFAV